MAAARSATQWDNRQAVDRLIAAPDDPLTPLLQSVRLAVLSVDTRISEGVTWNSPRCRCEGWFATAGLRRRDAVLVVLHQGAKVKDDSTAGMCIAAPAGLLRWAAKEWTLVRFGSLAEFETSKAAFCAIVSQWIGQRAASGTVRASSATPDR